MSGRLEEARAAVQAHLSERSYQHSVRTADAAMDLAATYQLPTSEAWLAGMLHDWARDDDPQRLLGKAEQLGLHLTETDREVPYLLHGPVGAAEIPEVLPWVPTLVLEAVRGHTLGSVDAGDLVKLLYVADTIEDHRAGADVQALREAVGSIDLDELYVRSYVSTLCTIVQRRRRLHAETLAVWNQIVDRSVR